MHLRCWRGLVVGAVMLHCRPHGAWRLPDTMQVADCPPPSADTGRHGPPFSSLTAREIWKQTRMTYLPPKTPKWTRVWETAINGGNALCYRRLKLPVWHVWPPRSMSSRTGAKQELREARRSRFHSRRHHRGPRGRKVSLRLSIPSVQIIVITVAAFP